MDCVRSLQSSSSSSSHLHSRKRSGFLHNQLQCRRSLAVRGYKTSFRPLLLKSSNLRILCGVGISPPQSTEEEKEGKMKSKSKDGSGKVWLNIRLDHQVEFGESVAVLGSSKELGSWKKKVLLNWTESGWVCQLEFKGDESIEYKFLIVRGDKIVRWEGGDTGFEASRWRELCDGLPLECDRGECRIVPNGQGGWC